MSSHYAVLGVSPSASPEDIRAAYRSLLLTSHPDKTGGAVARISVLRLKEAYEALSDPQCRAQYDKKLGSHLRPFLGSGLDLYTLETFVETDGIWARDCPRCSAQAAIVLTEEDLEAGTPDGAGGLQLAAPCLSCSLWITVQYEEVEDLE